MARGFEDRHEIYEDTGPRSQNGKYRIMEYLLVISIFILIIAVGYISDDLTSLSFIKALAGSCGYLAIRFVGTLFLTKSSKVKWSKAFVEKHLVEGLCFGAFLSIVVWQPDSGLSEAIRNYFILSLGYGLATGIFAPSKPKD